MPVLNHLGEPLNCPDEPLAEWAFRMYCLAEHDWRSAERNVYGPLDLDQASRDRHENLIGEGGLGVAQRRRANKGLALELCAAAAADQLDRPAEVRAYCKVNEAGRPNHFAPCGAPDLVADYGSFLAVLEVSAMKSPSDEDYFGQLDAALRHAERAADDFGMRGKPCFCLIVNERPFGDPAARRVFREFARERPQADWPRLAPFSVGAFAELAHWAHDQPEGAIQSDAVLAALSEVAELCLSDDPPAGDGWILETVKARLGEATPQLRLGKPKRRPDAGVTPK